MGVRKTYWHLAAAKRLPSDYEIATSRLLYHVDRGGFAVNLPTSRFYALHQRGSLLTSDRWEEFADPRATTYTKYVELQSDAESHVNRLLTATDTPEYERNLGDGWAERLGRIFSPLRFLCHGLQMVAAYIGQMAPGSRIAVAALFQCGDEIRRIQRVAYRVAQLARSQPEIVGEGATLWQSHPDWQPLRRAIERLLVTYDWGEALVALNVCIKPVVDDAFLIALAGLSDQSRDHIDAQILRSLFEDSRWHRDWTNAVLTIAFADNAANRDVVARWIEAWSPTVHECATAAATVVEVDAASAASEAGMGLRRFMSGFTSSRAVSDG